MGSKKSGLFPKVGVGNPYRVALGPTGLSFALHTCFLNGFLNGF
jgi:hypothetical protein